jgi:hypothetical protein
LHLGDDDGFGWVGVLWVAQKLDDGFGWVGILWAQSLMMGWILWVAQSLALSPENNSDLKWEIEPLTISQLSPKWGICRHVRERLVLLLHFARNKNILKISLSTYNLRWMQEQNLIQDVSKTSCKPAAEGAFKA